MKHIAERPDYKQQYDTILDKIVDIIKTEKKITVSELSEKTGIETQKLEEWAKVLEKEGMIKTHYPAIGSIQLLEPDTKIKKSKLWIFLLPVVIVVILVLVIL